MMERMSSCGGSSLCGFPYIDKFGCVSHVPLIHANARNITNHGDDPHFMLKFIIIIIILEIPTSHLCIAA